MKQRFCVSCSMFSRSARSCPDVEMKAVLPTGVGLGGCGSCGSRTRFRGGTPCAVHPLCARCAKKKGYFGPVFLETAAVPRSLLLFGQRW